MYASTSGDEYARDNGGYPGAKPGAVYPGSFYMQGIFNHDGAGMNLLRNSICYGIFILQMCHCFSQKTLGRLLATPPCWVTLLISDSLAPSQQLTHRTGWWVVFSFFIMAHIF